MRFKYDYTPYTDRKQLIKGAHHILGQSRPTHKKT